MPSRDHTKTNIINIFEMIRLIVILIVIFNVNVNVNVVQANHNHINELLLNEDNLNDYELRVLNAREIVNQITFSQLNNHKISYKNSVEIQLFECQFISDLNQCF